MPPPQTLRGLSGSELSGSLKFQRSVQQSGPLWALNCLLHDLYPWDLHNRHNRDIDHLINNTLRLWSLHGLLNSRDPWVICLCTPTGISSTLLRNCTCGISDCLRHDLHLWNLNVLGHLIDFLLDDGLLSLHCLLDNFGLLHFDCVDERVEPCVVTPCSV